jgi:hypothetical protein
MKQFTKTLLVAAIALAVTGVAEAKIASPVDATQFTGSEAVLTIWNTTLQKSFSLDLGVKQSAFLADTTSTRNWDFSTDANLISFLANNGQSDDIIYNVVSGSGSTNNQSALVSGGIYNGLTKKAASLSSYGLITTSSNSFADFKLVTSTSTKINNGISAVAGNIVALNSASGQSAGLDADNVSVYAATPADQGYAGTAFGTNLDGKLGSFNVFGDQSSTLDVFRASLNPTTGSGVVFTQFAGTYKLNLAAGTLQYSAVPLPAAVWMFGAGLMGMLRLNRRKSMAV